MNRIFSTLIALLVTTSSLATAQEPEEILERFIERTKISSVEELSDGYGSLCEMKYSAGLQSSDIKVIAKYPDQYRVTMKVERNETLIIITDGVAYITSEGKVEVIRDKSMIAQIIPLVDFAGQMAPRAEDFRNLEYIGREGRGKNECYVIEGVKIEGSQDMRLYFNIESELLSQVETTYISDEGKSEKLTIKAKEYKGFAENKLYLPSKFVAKTPEGNINISVDNFTIGYTTSPDMFKAPKL